MNKGSSTPDRSAADAAAPASSPVASLPATSVTDTTPGRGDSAEPRETVPATQRDITRRRWFIRIEWKPQDCWIGVFVKDPTYDHWSYWPEGTPSIATGPESKARWVRLGLDVWVCLLPMVPIHFGWKRELR